MNKIKYLIRSNTSLDYHETQVSSGADGADHIQAEPSACYFYYRCLTFQRPRPPGVEVGSNTAFILKINFGAKLLVSFLYYGVDVLFPIIHCILVLLVYPVKRLLTAQPKLPKQASNGSFTQLDSKFFFDDDSYHSTRPKRKGEFQLKRILIDNRSVNPTNLQAIKLFRSSSMTATFKGAPSTCTVPGKPAVNAGTCKS